MQSDSVTRNWWEMPKLKNSNETFWVFSNNVHKVDFLLYSAKSPKGLKLRFWGCDKKRFSWIQMDFYANNVFIFDFSVYGYVQEWRNWIPIGPKARMFCLVLLFRYHHWEANKEKETIIYYKEELLHWCIYVFPLPKEVLSPTPSSSLLHLGLFNCVTVVHTYSPKQI